MFVSEVAPAHTGIEWDALDVLLEDPEWIAAEFAAIMAAAGWKRDVLTAERPPSPVAGASAGPDAVRVLSRPAMQVTAPSVHERVRSPPP